jgi:DNA-binding protein WhiA
MSFSRDVKEELAAQIDSARHCRLAELAGIITMSGTYNDHIWQPDGENEYTDKKQDKLVVLLNIDVNSSEGRSSLKLKDENGSLCIDRILVERSCCKQAFLRGAFLAAGSVTNPAKGYHLEIVCESRQKADLIMALFSDFSMESRKILRKNHYVVYIKDGSVIVDVLNLMGAHKALMNMENIRIIKDMRNDVNRRVNCETANINKAVKTGVKQQEDIKLIIRLKGLNYLPSNLREIALLRLEEPELPLKELGELLDPPLGKSGVNHRLKKISEIAEELRRS